MNIDEKRWRAVQKRTGWKLPPKAHWLLRLPFICRVRGVFISIRVERHYRFWQAMGSVRSGYDEWVLYAIHRGWC